MLDLDVIWVVLKIFTSLNHVTKNDPYRSMLNRGSWINRLQWVEVALEDRGTSWEKNNV